MKTLEEKRVYNRAWYQANKERRKAYHNKWYKTHRAKQALNEEVKRIETDPENWQTPNS